MARALQQEPPCSQILGPHLAVGKKPISYTLWQLLHGEAHHLKITEAASGRQADFFLHPCYHKSILTGDA